MAVKSEDTTGQYLKAKCRRTGKLVQVRHFCNIKRDVYFLKRVLRELSICIETSRDKRKNLFTAQLIDVIKPNVNDSATMRAKMVKN